MTPARWAQIEELFSAALGTPEAERSRLLESACGGDAELCAEVERMLAGNEEPSWQSPAAKLLKVAAELAPGDAVAHYRIEARLGEGGMGVVYKAKDTRLGRSVALKFSSAQFSSRSEREARAVAALNHPNICTLYDVGTNYLVMELCEGETLAARLQRGKLSIEDAVRYGAQIADALAAAHARGIVHRDLKPGNVMLTKAGVKVLDFGLAKIEHDVASDKHTRTMTAEGTILGTLQYMSPEQLQGKEADTRSDLFSFGCVLYEMLTGKRAFGGPSAASVIAAILEREPAPLEIARPLDRVVRRSLAKDPDQRFQTARDLKAALAWAMEQPPPAATRRKSKLLWLLATAAAAGIVAGLLAGLHVASVPAVDLGKQHHILLVSETEAAFPVPRWAPDGKSFTYPSLSHLLTQGMDASVPTALQPLRFSGPVDPFFSPDGSRVWYTARQDNRSVWSIGAAGGDPRLEIRNLGGFGGSGALDGAALSPDGKSLVVAKVVNGGATTLQISSPPGAPLQPFPGAPTLNAEFNRIRLRFSHDGNKLLAVFLGARRAQDSGLWVIPWPAGKGVARRIDPGARLGATVASADWMLDNRHIVVGAGMMALSRGGRLLLLDSESASVWPLTPDNAEAYYPSVGPDGRILYVRQHMSYDLVETPVDGSAQRELLATDWTQSFGAWSRTADEFVFVSNRGGQYAVWISSADGSWQRKVVTSKDLGEAGEVGFRFAEFSPDGKRISYVGGPRIWISPAAGGRATPVTPPDETAYVPTWSADGKWIAYRTVDSLMKVSLMKVQVGGSALPLKIAETTLVPTAWSPDGKWITAGVGGGIGVVSPDGAEKRVLFHRPFPSVRASLGWSRDGATLFLLEGGAGDPVRLSAVDVATGRERLVHEYPPDNRIYGEIFQGGSRLYPSRDGKYLLGARVSYRASIWLLEGVEPPLSFWQRLLR